MAIPTEWMEEFEELGATYETPKIKLCPMCGHQGVWMIPTKDWLVSNYGFDGDIEAHTVECEHCGLTTSPYGSKFQAIAAWNERVPSAEEYLPPLYMRDDLVEIVRGGILEEFRTTNSAAIRITNLIEDYFERIWGK
jgi:hypothetical protein